MAIFLFGIKSLKIFQKVVDIQNICAILRTVRTADATTNLNNSGKSND
nr:MAG TPA: hypothetical protein [Caudoviricetes sp.]